MYRPQIKATNAAISMRNSAH